MKQLCLLGLVLFIHSLFAQVTIRTITADHSHKPCPKPGACDINFPVISATDKLVEQHVNAALMDEFGDRDMQDRVFESDFIPVDDSNNATHFIRDLQYEVFTNSSRILSIKFEGGGQGAYYSPFSACRNFDLYTGFSPQLIELVSMKYYMELAGLLRDAKQKAIQENRDLLIPETALDSQDVKWLNEEDENWMRYGEPEDFYIRSGDLFLEDDAKKTYPHYMLPLMPYLDTLMIPDELFKPHLTEYGNYIFGQHNTWSIPLVKQQFRGNIGNETDIKLVFTINNYAWLNKQDQPVEGYYFNTDIGKLVYVRGHSDGKSLSLDVYDHDNKLTEKFEGKIYHINGTDANEPSAPAVINGNWTDLKTGQTQNFYIQESYY